MEKTKYVGFGFCDILLVTFIVLKLVGVISWSWVWVLAPLWIQFALVGVIIFIIGILAIIVHRIEKE